MNGRTVELPNDFSRRPNALEWVLDRVTVVTLPRPRVQPELILRLQKYRKPEAVPEPIRQAAQAAAALAETLVKPQARLRRVPVTHVDPDGSVVLAEGVQFQSRALARLLRGATEAILVLLTLGPMLETRAEAMIADEQFLEALLLDTAGWAAIEALARALRRRLSIEAKAEGVRLTNRMAPGYADWRLEEQRILFSVFGKDGLPIQLTEACVMLPRKSISGIYGLVPGGSKS